MLAESRLPGFAERRRVRDYPQVLKMNAHLVNAAHYPAFNAVRARLFEEPRPASTVVVVTGFVIPDALVEIELIAKR